MLTGIKLKSYPTREQKKALSQWMGCARFIYNAKCAEDRYFRNYARKYCPINVYAPVDQTYSQFKDKEPSPFLFDVPSVILRNSASNWYQSYRRFFKGLSGRPVFKKKSERQSVLLTSELFTFTKEQGRYVLHIGTKKHPVGLISLKIPKGKTLKPSKMIVVSKSYGHYWVAFCYEDGFCEKELPTSSEHFKNLKSLDIDELNECVLGIDRGVAIAVQAGEKSYTLSAREQAKQKKLEKKKKKLQKKLSRCQKGSHRSYRVRGRLAKVRRKKANIRDNFCHQVSRKIVDTPEAKVIVLEDLKIKNMTKKAAPKVDESGRYLRNNKKAKSGLNRSILEQGWYKFESYLKYKSYKAGKACFKVQAAYSSQECAHCGHIHPSNRESQSLFLCQNCGHSDNADINAAKVLKNRAVKLLKNCGTQLSRQGVLSLPDKGRGAHGKSSLPKGLDAQSEKNRKIGSEASKKTKSKVLVA